jgi:signal transduction histidine kinase
MAVALGWKEVLPLVAAIVGSGLVAAQVVADGHRAEALRGKLEQVERALRAVESLSKSLLDAENSERGYLLTADESFLFPYGANVQAIDDPLDQVETLAPGLWDGMRIHDRLRPAIHAKLEDLRKSILARQNLGPNTAVETSLISQGESRSREIRTTLSEMRTRALNVFESRLNEISRYESRSVYLSSRAGLLFIALVVMAALRINASFRRVRPLLAQLAEGERRYHALADRLQAAREEERRELARGIHDEVGQSLTALKLDLFYIKRTLPPGRPDLAERVSEGLTMIESTIQIVRRMAMELRPAILDQLGLAAALEWQLNQIQARTELECRLERGPVDPELDPQQQIVLFRIAQEALTNVVRHAHAACVTVTLRSEQGDCLLLIEDDGVGASPDVVEDPQSIGLFGMSERASLIGGTCQLVTGPGQGTTVTVTVPLRRAAGATA